MTHRSCGLTRSSDKLKHYISSTTVSMDTKLGRIVVYPKRLLPKELLTLWSRGLPRSREKLKNIVSPLPQCQWPQNLVGW